MARPGAPRARTRLSMGAWGLGTGPRELHSSAPGPRCFSLGQDA